MHFIGKENILILVLNALLAHSKTVSNIQNVTETGRLLLLKGSEWNGNSCNDGRDCNYPLICVEQRNNKGKVCKSMPCNADADCVDRLKCVEKSNNEGKVCRRKPCTNDVDCEYPLTCVHLQEGSVCEHQRCAGFRDCPYPLTCGKLNFREGRFCSVKPCTDDEDCEYPLGCVQPDGIKSKVCARQRCFNENDCGYPLKCYDENVGRGLCARKQCIKAEDRPCQYPFICIIQSDEEGAACARRKCTTNYDCEYPLSCIDQGNGEGKVCDLRQCEKNEDCEFPLKCDDNFMEERSVCTRRKCSNNEDCYPLECVEQGDEEGKVCSRRKCKQNSDCQYPQKCQDRGDGEGFTCNPELCTKDEHCEYRHCEYQGVWGRKVCSSCDCGPNGTCSFENGEKKCKCDKGFADKGGKCEVTEASTSVTTESSKIITTILTSTRPDCYCGPATKSCFLGSSGDKICSCFPGHTPVNGYCVVMDTTSSEESTTVTSTIHTSTTQYCYCGENSISCFYRRNGTKVCNCEFGYIQIKGYCIGICSEDKCVHGKCEIIENNFKCRCNKGFTGRRCEDKIETKSDKQDTWKIIQVSILFSMFVLLSGVLCSTTRILNKMPHTFK